MFAEYKIILITYLLSTFVFFANSFSQEIKTNTLASLETTNISKAWIPDNGDGTYKNPIIFADYVDFDLFDVELKSV